MASFEHEIVNRALLHLGQEPFTQTEWEAEDPDPLLPTSFTSVRMETMQTLYDTVRKSVFREHAWNFATVRGTLTRTQQTGDTDDTLENYVPPWGFANAFDLPDRCIRIIRNEEMQWPWRVMSDYVRTDTLPAEVFTQKVFIATDDSNGRFDWIEDIGGFRAGAAAARPSSEVVLYDELFVQAFAAKLAYESAQRLGADPQKRQESFSIFQTSISEAQYQDARETSLGTDTIEGYQWTRERIGGAPLMPNTLQP